MQQKSGRATPRRARVLYWALLGCLAACTAAPPPAPFARAGAPSPERARIYIYRADPRPSLSTIRLSIDGQPLGAIRNQEYETLEVIPGTHELRAALRGWGFAAWGWNQHKIRLSPGEIAFLRLSVRLTERPLPGRALEIGGRSGGAASENVYFEQRSGPKAWKELAATTRIQSRPCPSGTCENSSQLRN